jgi:hypothetical protein
MTVCVDEYNSSGRCLTQLQKQKMLGVAHTYKIFSSVHHVAQHTTPHYGFRIVGRKFNYRGHGGYEEILHFNSTSLNERHIVMDSNTKNV